MFFNLKLFLFLQIKQHIKAQFSWAESLVKCVQYVLLSCNHQLRLPLNRGSFLT